MNLPKFPDYLPLRFPLIATAIKQCFVFSLIYIGNEGDGPVGITPLDSYKSLFVFLLNIRHLNSFSEFNGIWSPSN